MDFVEADWRKGHEKPSSDSFLFANLNIFSGDQIRKIAWWLELKICGSSTLNSNGHVSDSLWSFGLDGPSICIYLYY